jgi:hypothetical protein
VARVSGEWRTVLSEAFAGALDEYGLDRDGFPLAAWVTLVYTFNLGIEADRLSGVDSGHRELLEAIDRWLESREEAKER